MEQGELSCSREDSFHTRTRTRWVKHAQAQAQTMVTSKAQIGVLVDQLCMKFRHGTRCLVQLPHLCETGISKLAHTHMPATQTRQMCTNLLQHHLVGVYLLVDRSAACNPLQHHLVWHHIASPVSTRASCRASVSSRLLKASDIQ
jgi:hypothetical protein